jgi:hypothetical protein
MLMEESIEVQISINKKIICFVLKYYFIINLYLDLDLDLDLVRSTSQHVCRFEPKSFCFFLTWIIFF